jgi:hypothetical protein
LTLYHQFQTLPSPLEHTRNHRQKHLLANTLSQNTEHVSRLPPSLLSLKEVSLHWPWQLKNALWQMLTMHHLIIPSTTTTMSKI